MKKVFFVNVEKFFIKVYFVLYLIKKFCFFNWNEVINKELGIEGMNIGWFIINKLKVLMLKKLWGRFLSGIKNKFVMVCM